MSSAPIQEAAIERSGKWEAIGIDDANELPKDGIRFRCLACGGQMAAFKKYADGARAHFEHLIKHTGCKLSVYCYSGTPSTHPQAIS